ncbi:hypothetical protein BDR26DRAFT_864239 [Obelidium mucronatum]|nr:hypothetical protein BDR26DRAFT_864239 [Obelidium mucronatum]
MITPSATKTASSTTTTTTRTTSAASTTTNPHLMLSPPRYPHNHNPNHNHALASANHNAHMHSTSASSSATSTSTSRSSYYGSLRSANGILSSGENHMPLPSARALRPPSRASAAAAPAAASSSAGSSLHTATLHGQQGQQQQGGTTLQVSVKQKNGNVATITTTPAKVTIGFISCDAGSLNSNGSCSGGGGAGHMARGYRNSASHPGSTVGSVSGSYGRSFDASSAGVVDPSDPYHVSPTQMSPTGLNGTAGSSYSTVTSSSRNSYRSGVDAFESGSAGVLPARRIYSNASSSSASSLQTFFGIGEGQALKMRLQKEAEMKDQQYQLMLIEQQQIRQQQQNNHHQHHHPNNNQHHHNHHHHQHHNNQQSKHRDSHRDLTSSGSSSAASVAGRIDSKELMGKDTASDENTAESSLSGGGGNQKASFAIGDDEEFSDGDDPDTLQAVPTRKSSREFSKGASMRSSGSSGDNRHSQSNQQQQHQQQQYNGKRMSPEIMYPESSIAPSVRLSLEKSSNSPLLPRRTFPSAPYLPLYNQPKSVSSVKSPVSASTKLILNPNPNSSSAADIPVKSANTSPALKPIDGTNGGNVLDSAVPPPIPITRTISHKHDPSTNAIGGAGGAAAGKVQPPELQAPLHQTPTANATSEADIQAAAAAARARGQNLPRTIPEFYKRLQDLRHHNILQLVALRDQISLLKSRKSGDGVLEGHGMEYYEREMGRVIELARRDEGYLVEFGRRGMGIDVNTLSLMLSNLPTFDPNEPVKRGHQDQYPHTQDHIRRTKSFAAIPALHYQQQQQQHNQLQYQQQQQHQVSAGHNLQPLQRAFSSQRIAIPENHVAPAATAPAIPRTRSYARVVDLQHIQRETAQYQQQQQQQQRVVPGTGQNHIAVPPNAQQVEYLQMQYNTQMGHIVTKQPVQQYQQQQQPQNPNQQTQQRQSLQPQHQQHQPQQQMDQLHSNQSGTQEQLERQNHHHHHHHQEQEQEQEQPQSYEEPPPKVPPPVLQQRFSSTATEVGGAPSTLPSAIFSTVSQFSSEGDFEEDEDDQDYDDEDDDDDEDYDDEDADEDSEFIDNAQYTADKLGVAVVPTSKPAADSSAAASNTVIGAGLGVVSVGAGVTTHN